MKEKEEYGQTDISLKFFISTWSILEIKLIVLMLSEKGEKIYQNYQEPL